MRESDIDALVDMDSDLPKEMFDHWSLVLLAIYISIQEAWELIEDKTLYEAGLYGTY